LLQSVTTTQNKISPKQDEVFVSFETAGPKVFGGLTQPPTTAMFSESKIRVFLDFRMCQRMTSTISRPTRGVAWRGQSAKAPLLQVEM